MPWIPLYLMFGGMLAMTIVTLQRVSRWKSAIAACAIGAVVVVVSCREQSLWPSLYAPWLLGVLYGGARSSTSTTRADKSRRR
jgi:hypothetical protein